MVGWYRGTYCEYTLLGHKTELYNIECMYVQLKTLLSVVCKVILLLIRGLFYKFCVKIE